MAISSGSGTLAALQVKKMAFRPPMYGTLVGNVLSLGMAGGRNQGNNAMIKKILNIVAIIVCAGLSFLASQYFFPSGLDRFTGKLVKRA